MNTKARYTLLLVQRLVTSLTVTKRDARGFAEECGAELTSYWTERKRSHTPLLPLPVRIGHRLNVCECLSLQPLNKFPSSPPMRFMPYSSRENYFAAARPLGHTSFYAIRLATAPFTSSTLLFSLHRERERERETSPLRFRFIYSFIVLVKITKSTYAIGSVEKEGEEKIVRPYEKKETRLRRRLRGSNATRQGTARRGEERRFTR